MNRIIKWHKAYANEFMKMLSIDWYTLAWVSWVKGIIMGIMIMTLLSSCGTTQTIPHACDLMNNGQQCLPDHSCCK